MQTLPPPLRYLEPEASRLDGATLLPKAGLVASGALHAGIVFLAVTLGLPEARYAETREDIIEIVIEAKPDAVAASDTSQPKIATSAPAVAANKANAVRRPQPSAPVAAPQAESLTHASNAEASDAEETSTPAATALAATGSGSVPAATGGPSMGPEALPGNPRPEYPAMARRGGLEGQVMLRVAIAPDGRIAEVQVLRSSGAAQLDRAAMDALSRWRFRPAMVDGVAVAASLEIPVSFRLTE